jgi:hypothetical protein
MSVEDKTRTSRWRLSLDGWAVLTAFVLAAVVRFGIVKHVPW